MQISRSPEMTAFVISGTDCNRPIPRRIVEDAGVPREAFGVCKTAADRLPWQEQGFLGPSAMAD